MIVRIKRFIHEKLFQIFKDNTSYWINQDLIVIKTREGIGYSGDKNLVYTVARPENLERTITLNHRNFVDVGAPNKELTNLLEEY